MNEIDATLTPVRPVGQTKRDLIDESGKREILAAVAVAPDLPAWSAGSVP